MSGSSQASLVQPGYDPPSISRPGYQRSIPMHHMPRLYHENPSILMVWYTFEVLHGATPQGTTLPLASLYTSGEYLYLPDLVTLKMCPYTRLERSSSWAGFKRKHHTGNWTRTSSASTSRFVLMRLLHESSGQCFQTFYISLLGAHSISVGRH